MKKYKNNKKSNKFLLIMIFSIFVVIVLQFYLMNSIDTYDSLVGNMVSKYETLSESNQTLQQKISTTQSIANIESSLVKKGYKNAKTGANLPQATYTFNITK